MKECAACGKEDGIELVTGYLIGPLCKERFTEIKGGDRRVDYDKLKAAVEERRRATE